MTKLYTLTLLILGIIISTLTYAQITTPMFAVSPYPNDGVSPDSIWMFPDTSDLSILNPGVALTTTTGAITGCNGMAVRPCTKEIYIVYKSSGSRYLGIVNPLSGVVTEVGDLGDNVAGICFGSENQLYAVTGDGATVGETLFKVNISTAAMTQFVPYGNGDDGEQIAFCSDNGFIYHWSGIGNSVVMERTDTATGATINIPLTGDTLSEVFGSLYLGKGTFLVTNIDRATFLVDTSGFSQITPDTLPEFFRGFGLPVSLITTDGETSICAGDSTTFTSIAGDSYQWYRDGAMIPGETGPTLTASQGGNYQCEIASNGCITLSNAIALSVLNIPGVGINPGPVAYLCAAEDSVLLTGSMGGSSQWLMNGTMIAGATTNQYWAKSTGIYNMIKTNQNGCSDSAAVGTEVIFPPTTSLTPVDTVIICPGDSSLLMTTEGATAYEWYLDGAAIAGAEGDSLYAKGEGLYTVVAVFGECRDSVTRGAEIIFDEDSCATGIRDELFARDLEVYPVPAEDFINVSWTASTSAEITLEVYAVDGKMMKKKAVSILSSYVNLSVDVNTLSPGVYLLRVSQDNRSRTAKFVKR